jgi:hypothetical protein
MKATVLITAWIQVSPNQLPSADDISYFSRVANLPETDIHKVFLTVLTEKAVHGTKPLPEAATDEAKPSAPNALSRSPKVILANSETLSRAAEWLSKQNMSCRKPTGHSTNPEAARSGGPFPCSFCGRNFSTKDTWKRHEELLYPQEGWLCNLDTIVQFEDGTQCTHCDAQTPNPDHFHVEHPDYTKAGPCCRQTFGRRVFRRKDGLKSHLKSAHPSISSDLYDQIVLQSHFAVSSTFEEDCKYCQLPESYKFLDWEDRCTHLCKHFKKMESGKSDHNRHDDSDEPKDDSDVEDDDTDPKPPRKRARMTQIVQGSKTADQQVSVRVNFQ